MSLCRPSIRQRCRIHFTRNALADAGKSGRRVVAAFIATAFAQDDVTAAKTQWREVADQLRDASKARCLRRMRPTSALSVHVLYFSPAGDLVAKTEPRLEAPSGRLIIPANAGNRGVYPAPVTPRPRGTIPESITKGK